MRYRMDGQFDEAKKKNEETKGENDKDEDDADELDKGSSGPKSKSLNSPKSKGNKKRNKVSSKTLPSTSAHKGFPGYNNPTNLGIPENYPSDMNPYQRPTSGSPSRSMGMGGGYYPGGSGGTVEQDMMASSMRISSKTHEMMNGYPGMMPGGGTNAAAYGSGARSDGGAGLPPRPVMMSPQEEEEFARYLIMKRSTGGVC